MKISFYESLLILLILGTLLNLFYPLLPMWVLPLLLLIYMHYLVAGAMLIRMNVFIRSVNSVADFGSWQKPVGAKKTICLSFDDGIHPVNTLKCLDLLKIKNVKAHFFLIGKNISGHEDVLLRMVQDNHVIGNHSFTHDIWFDLQNSNKMANEIARTNNCIRAVTGISPLLFRPPYGVTNPNLARAIQKSRMISMGWNLRSFDTVARSPEKLLKQLISKTRPGCIVLLHERCDITLAVLTDYIDYCLREGYTFVTLNPADES